MRFEYYNPNPREKNVGDCTIRALSKALEQDWEKTFVGLSVEGFYYCDMPSSNAVWGSFLRMSGFHRELTPDDITVEEFADSNKNGTFVLALSGHVVCLIDNVLYDTWDSRNEIVLYYWKRKER